MKPACADAQAGDFRYMGLLFLNVRTLKLR